MIDLIQQELTDKQKLEVNLNVKHGHGSSSHSIMVFSQTSLQERYILSFKMQSKTSYLSFLKKKTSDVSTCTNMRPSGFSHLKARLIITFRLTWYKGLLWCFTPLTSSWSVSTQTTSKTREAMRISTGAGGRRSSVKTSSVERSHGNTPGVQSCILAILRII